MTNKYFDQPQRQSAIGIVVLFSDALFHYVKAFGPLLVIFLLKFEQSKFWLFIGGFLLVALLITGIAVLRYLNFTFQLDYDKQEFVIREGILNKTTISVPLSKIQQVNLTQNLLQRIINVYAVELETAGSQEREGKIRAVAHGVALELKEALLQHGFESSVDTSGCAQEHQDSSETVPFLKISVLSLVKLGLTSNYLRSFSLLLIFLLTLLDYAEKFYGTEIYEQQMIDDRMDFLQWTQLTIFFVLILIGVVLVFNLVRTLLKYFDYTIQKQTGSLLITYGLLNTQKTILKPNRVQMTAFSRNYFQKKLNVMEFRIKQAAQGHDEERRSTIEIPGCNDHEKNELMQLIFQKQPTRGLQLLPNFRKLVFALFLTVGLPTGAFFVVRNHWTYVDWHFEYMLGFYVILMSVVQYFKFRNNRLYVDDEFIILQSGAWDVKTEIIQCNRIQAITTSQLFWHKNIRIGSLVLHTAGGRLAFQLGDFDKIKHFVNRWLYHIERTDSNWM